jgi:hypothetical protein
MKDETIDELINRLLFVLSERTENILDFAHYNSVLLIYHYLKGSLDKGNQILRQRRDNIKIKAIRESSIIFEFGNVLYNNDIDKPEKFLITEGTLAQLDILRLPIYKILLSVIQYSFIEDSDTTARNAKIKQIEEEMRKYNYINLIPYLENLNKSET